MAPVSLTPQYPAQPYGFAPPPSPPLDDSNKCSLPSISNLLVMADQGSPTSETSPQSQQCMAGRPILIPGNCAETNHFSVHFSKSDNRPNSSQFGNPASVRANLPPSPPMSSEASFEGYHSPSSKPTSQSQGSSNYYYETTPPLSQHEADSRQMATAAPRAPVQPSTFQSQYPSPAGYSSQSGINPYYPPMQPTPPPQQQMPALYYQRPLPQVRIISRIQERELILTCALDFHPFCASVSYPGASHGSEPLATSPLYCPFFHRLVPAVSGPVYLPDLQQGLLSA